MDTPGSKQGLGQWWQHQSTQGECVQSVWAGPLTKGERAPTGDVGVPAGGGEEEEPRGGLPYFPSSPAFRPQMFLQNSLGDLNSLANLGRSWSLMSPKSKHLRRLLLSAALLTLLPCLELTIIAHQPLAKTYSMVVTVAVCPHKATTTTALGRSLIA